MTLDPQGDDLRSLTAHLDAAMLEHTRRSIRRLLGDFSGRSFDERFSDVGATKPPPSLHDGLTFQQLVERFMSDPARGHLTEKTRLDYQAGFKTLAEIIGPDAKVATITRDRCREVLDVLLRLPPNARKRFPGVPALRLAEMTEAKRLRTLSPRSINDTTSQLSMLFSWAMREGLADKNPAKGLRVRVPRAEMREARLPFSTDQLQTLFGSKFCEPGAPRAGLYWLPLIATFTGASLGELVRLKVEDVKTLDGVTVLMILSRL